MITQKKCKYCGTVKNLFFLIKDNKKITHNICVFCRNEKIKKASIKAWENMNEEKKKERNKKIKDSLKNNIKLKWRKGITNIELYGVERAKEINKKRVKNTDWKSVSEKLKKNNPMFNKEIKIKHLISINKPEIKLKKTISIKNFYKTELGIKEKLKKAEICRLNFKGKPSKLKGKTWEEIYGIKRAKQRKSSINYLNVFKGSTEDIILDDLEYLLNITIIRQYKCLNYFIDGYIKELNLAIEIDEKHHKHQKKEDLYRQMLIEKELKCRFLRLPYNSTEGYLEDIVNSYINKVCLREDKKEAD